MATATRPPGDTPDATARPRPPRRRLARLGTALVATYAAALALLALAMWTAPVDWAWVNLVLYAPRWVFLTPLAPLAVIAPLSGRRAALLWLAALAIAIGPVRGVCVPWRAWLAGGGKPSGELRVRVLSCNAEGMHIDPQRLGDLIDAETPDLVILQEYGGDAPMSFLRRPGWQVRRGQGVTIASRFPISRAENLDPARLGGRGAGMRCEVAIAGRGVPVYSLHLPTPRDGLESTLRYRWWTGLAAVKEVSATQWHSSEVARGWLGEATGPAIIGGDFNLPVEHAAYRRFWSGLANAFSTAGLGPGGTKVTRWHTARIDHILAGDSWRPTECRVGPDVGSDHRPVIAELRWTGPPP